MANSIGTLVGFLRLDDQQYNAALKRNAAAATDFAKGLTRRFLAIAGPTALALKLVQLGRSALNTADNFDDLATRIGATFEGVQVLNQLARSTGGTADIFVKGLDNINKELLELKNGSLKAYAPFKTLGLSIKEFEDAPAEKRIELIARALEDAADKTKALAAVSQILGAKATPALRDALEQLAKRGYAGVRDAATEAGLVIDKRVGKELDLAKKEIENFETRLTIFVGRFLADIRRMRDEAQADATPLLSASQQRNVTNSAVTSIRQRAAALQSLAERDALIAELNESIGDLRARIQAQDLQQLDQTSPITAAQRERLNGDVRLLKQMEIVLRGIKTEYIEDVIAINAATAATKKLADENERLRREKEAAEFEAKLREMAKEAGIAKTEAESLTLTLKRLAEAHREGSISVDGYKVGLIEAQNESRPFKTALEGVAFEMIRIQRLQSLGLISNNAYADTVEDMADQLREIKSPLEQYREELRRINRLQRDGVISADALAIALRDARRSLGGSILSEIQSNINAAGQGRPSGTNASRSAERALERARRNAGRGNVGAAEEDLKRVNELTRGKKAITLEDILGDQASKEKAEVATTLPTQVGQLVKAINGIAEKLVVAK